MHLHPQPFISTAIIAATLSMLVGCNGGGSVPNPFSGESHATVLPLEADMIAEGRHDVLIVACQERVDWGDIITPFVVTAFFVSLGRLDVVFYLPDAVAASLIPDCDPVAHGITNARVEGEGFELEPTENPAAFRVRATTEAEGTFRATVVIGGETIEVASQLRAHTPDRIDLTSHCGFRAEHEQRYGYPVDEHLFQFDQPPVFSVDVHRGDMVLAGYDFNPFDPEDVEMVQTSSRGTQLRLLSRTESGTLTSRYDDDFAFDYRNIGIEDFDRFELAPANPAEWFVGQERTLRPLLTVDGVLPCQHTGGLELTLETPDVCTVRAPFDPERASTGGHTFEAVAPGACQVTVDVPGTDFSATHETTVHADWTIVEVETLERDWVLTEMVVENGEYFVVGKKTDNLGTDWALLYTENGQWTSRAVDSGVYELDAAGGHVFAAGSTSVLEYDGTDWTEHFIADADPERFISLMHARTPTDVWVRSAQTMLHYDGNSWSPFPTPAGARVADIWSAEGGPLYLLTNESLHRLEGSEWIDALPDHPAFESVAGPGGITGRAADDIWLYGGSLDETVMHFDGTTWETRELPQHEQGSVQTGILWPVRGGEQAFLFNRTYGWAMHYNGAGTTLLPRPGDTRVSHLTGENDDVYLVGEQVLFKMTYTP